MQRYVIFALFIVIASAAEAPYPAKGPYNAKPGYDYGPPMPFAFGYAIKDQYNNDYAHDTRSDGKVRTGVYRTLLPDGRVQIVSYKADENGYVADVKYQGEAKYDYKPAGYKPPYQPAPAYPKPVYPKPAYPKPAAKP